MYCTRVILLLCGLHSFGAVYSETFPNAVYSFIYLYRGHNYDDKNLYIGNALPDLEVQEFDNMAHSMNYVGLWILYENKNYNTDEEGLVIWRNSSAATKEVLRNNGIGGKISSLRPVGPTYPDQWNPSSLNFFQGVNFTGQVSKAITGPTAEIDLKIFTSLITVGKSITWTFYDQKNFNGNGKCFTTTDVINYHPDLNENGVGLDLSRVASIEKGCWEMHGVPAAAPGI